MKKILALILSLCLVLSLAACGGSSSETTTAKAGESTAKSGETTAKADEGTKATESTQAPETTPAPAKDKIKVGMVTDVGGVNDQSFNQTSWEGLQALQKEDPTFEVKYLDSKTDADYQTNINTFIDDGYDLIICVGYMLADATKEAAEANPDQKFAIIDDATCASLPNVACLMFAQE